MQLVLSVGDDENDEDAFALDGNIVPVRMVPLNELILLESPVPPHGFDL